MEPIAIGLTTAAPLTVLDMVLVGTKARHFLSLVLPGAVSASGWWLA